MRINLQVLTITFLLFYSFSFLFRDDLSFEQDLGRHLKLGEIIWQTKSVPKTNLFSYTNPDFPFINHHWLFELVIFLISQINLNLLLILKVLIILVSIFLTLKVTFIPLTLPLGFIFLHLVRERIELRPEIFSFLFTSLNIYLLDKFQKNPGKIIYLLPLISLFWVNTHIYFPLGLALQAIYFSYFFIYKRQHFKIFLPVFFLSIVASLINPFFLQGFLYPLKIFGNYGYTIAENQTVFFLESLGFTNPNYLFFKVIISITVCSVIFGFFKKTLSLPNFLIIAFSLVLSLLHIRSIPYLFFLSFPAVVTNFGTFKVNLLFRMLFFITAILITAESLYYLNGDYYKYSDSAHTNELEFRESGKYGLDFLNNNNLPGPIFNNFDLGSFIIYKSYPKYQVFVDGRPEGYPAKFFQEVYIPVQTNKEKFNELQKKYQFKTILFSHTDQTPWGKSFLKTISQDKDWKVVYLDDFIIILSLLDKGINLNSIEVDAYKFSNHLSYLKMALFFDNLELKNISLQFTKKALEVFPESPKANIFAARLIFDSLGPNSNYLQYLNFKNPFWW